MKKFKKIALCILGILCMIALSAFAFYKIEIEPALKINIASNQLEITDKFDKNIIDSIYKYSKENIRNSNVISFAMIENGEVSYYGLERKNDILKTIDAKDSLFQIGSISKVFTSTIFANLILSNEINPEETIDKYLGFKLKNDLKIKIKDLSNHTSGLDRLHNLSKLKMLEDFDNPYKSYSDSWMTSYLKTEIEIDENKKGKSEYSNFGVAILGNVMSKFKNTSYENLLQKTILEKYKMSNTFIYSDIYKSKLVRSIDVEDSITTNWILNAYSPAGGIVSNIQDMVKFALAQFDTTNKDLTLTQVPTIRIDSIMQIGLGWHIIKSKINHKVLFHNGATGNFTSTMSLDMDSKKGIIILSSACYSDTKGNIDKMGSSIIKRLNKK